MCTYSERKFDLLTFQLYNSTPRVMLKRLSEEEKSKYLLRSKKVIANNNKEDEQQILKNENESIKLQENKGTIKIRNIYTLLDEKYTKMNNDLIEEKDIKSVIRSNLHSNLNNMTNEHRLSLCEVKRLYKKYFSNLQVQNSIIIVANIITIIELSHRHLIVKMDESFKNETEAEKLAIRNKADKIHKQNQQILELELKRHFEEVISSIFSYYEFEFRHTFQICFSSLLKLLRVMDRQTCKNDDILKKLVLMFLDSLNNSSYNHSKLISFLKSNLFSHECCMLLNLIKDSCKTDPGIPGQMPLFFLSRTKYDVIEAVVNSVTYNLHNLHILLDEVVINCFLQSKFDSPNYFSSPVTKLIRNNHLFTLPVQTSISSTRQNYFWCHRKLCQETATMICTVCMFGKYCSKECQVLDFDDSHSCMCELIKSVRL